MYDSEIPGHDPKKIYKQYFNKLPACCNKTMTSYQTQNPDQN